MYFNTSGDDVLEISSEGINFVSADEESDNNEEIETNDSPDSENENNNESNENEDETFAQKDNELENNKENEPNSTNVCEAQDHSDITESIEGELYIPECAILTDISKSGGAIRASLVIEESNWEDITVEYLNDLGDQITRENQYISNENVKLMIKYENP